MPERAVYKSTAAEYLDDLFSGSVEDLERAYRESLDLMDGLDGAPLSEAAAQLVEAGDLPKSAVENSRTGWRAGTTVDRIIGCAYREAMKLARDKPEPVPIETLWITGAADDFEVHICDGKRQITVTMFIPEGRDYGSKRASARSWVIRAGADGDPADAPLSDDGDPPIVMVQVSGPQ